jgi:TRAP-type C4-dicarboxylate transport system substrate-binding protein
VKTVNAFICTVILGVLSNVAIANGPSWNRLAPEHQEVLSDFQSNWENLPNERREKLLKRAESWQQLSPECREALQNRWRELRELPPEVRNTLRERWQNMTPEQRREAMQSSPHKARCQQTNER